MVFGLGGSDYLVVIGRNLRRIRESRGLTITELSRRAGVAKSTLSMIEAGKSNPTIGTLWAIANALKVPFSELIEPATIVSEDGVSIKLVEGVGDTEIYLMKLRKGSARRAKPHKGVLKEYVLVVKGSLITGPMSNPKYVGELSTYSFRGDVDHVYASPDTDSVAIVILKYGGRE